MHENIFAWSKLKAFAEDYQNKAEMADFVLDRVENIVGNGKNVGYQHILLFPQCFRKAAFPGPLKPGIVW